MIKACDNCGGLYATETNERYAGMACQCPSRQPETSRYTRFDQAAALPYAPTLDTVPVDIYGPCSACGDGDTDQKYHSHAARPPVGDYKRGLLRAADRCAEQARRAAMLASKARSEDSLSGIEERYTAMADGLRQMEIEFRAEAENAQHEGGASGVGVALAELREMFPSPDYWIRIDQSVLDEPAMNKELVYRVTIFIDKLPEDFEGATLAEATQRVREWKARAEAEGGSK